jgi:hypothetical protein
MPENLAKVEVLVLIGALLLCKLLNNLSFDPRILIDYKKKKQQEVEVGIQPDDAVPPNPLNQPNTISDKEPDNNIPPIQQNLIDRILTIGREAAGTIGTTYIVELLALAIPRLLQRIQLPLERMQNFNERLVREEPIEVTQNIPPLERMQNFNERLVREEPIEVTQNIPPLETMQNFNERLERMQNFNERLVREEPIEVTQNIPPIVKQKPLETMQNFKQQLEDTAIINIAINKRRKEIVEEVNRVEAERIKAEKIQAEKEELIHKQNEQNYKDAINQRIDELRKQLKKRQDAKKNDEEQIKSLESISAELSSESNDIGFGVTLGGSNLENLELIQKNIKESGKNIGQLQRIENTIKDLIIYIDEDQREINILKQRIEELEQQKLIQTEAPLIQIENTQRIQLGPKSNVVTLMLNSLNKMYKENIKLFNSNPNKPSFNFPPQKLGSGKIHPRLGLNRESFKIPKSTLEQINFRQEVVPARNVIEITEPPLEQINFRQEVVPARNVIEITEPPLEQINFRQEVVPARNVIEITEPPSKVTTKVRRPRRKIIQKPIINPSFEYNKNETIIEAPITEEPKGKEELEEEIKEDKASINKTMLEILNKEENRLQAIINEAELTEQVHKRAQELTKEDIIELNELDELVMTEQEKALKRAREKEEAEIMKRDLEELEEIVREQKKSESTSEDINDSDNQVSDEDEDEDDFSNSTSIEEVQRIQNLLNYNAETQQILYQHEAIEYFEQIANFTEDQFPVTAFNNLYDEAIRAFTESANFDEDNLIVFQELYYVFLQKLTIIFIDISKHIKNAHLNNIPTDELFFTKVYQTFIKQKAEVVLELIRGIHNKFKNIDIKDTTDIVKILRKTLQQIAREKHYRYVLDVIITNKAKLILDVKKLQTSNNIILFFKKIRENIENDFESYVNQISKFLHDNDIIVHNDPGTNNWFIEIDEYLADIYDNEIGYEDFDTIYAIYTDLVNLINPVKKILDSLFDDDNIQILEYVAKKASAFNKLYLKVLVNDITAEQLKKFKEHLETRIIRFLLSISPHGGISNLNTLLK